MKGMSKVSRLTSRGFWVILAIMIMATFVIEAIIRRILGG
nr:MAG TPA: hypothetical protein [Caudoviricetes sp.]